MVTIIVIIKIITITFVFILIINQKRGEPLHTAGSRS